MCDRCPCKPFVSGRDHMLLAYVQLPTFTAFLFHNFCWSFVTFTSRTAIPLIFQCFRICPSILATSPTKQNKQPSINSSSWMLWCVHTVAPLSKQFIAVSPWSSTRSLASAMPPILDSSRDVSQLSCYCPESCRACGFGSVRPALSYTPAAHRWGGCWGGPAQSPGSGPG